MGIYDKEKSISRKDLRLVFQKDRGIIRGGEGKYSRKEREDIVKGLFGRSYGSQISKQDYKKRVRKMEVERRIAGSSADREKIDDKIKYLKQIGGRDI